MNLIQRMFGKKVEEKQCDIDSVSCSGASKEEERLIDKVTELLKDKPETFSAKWFGDGCSMDKSVSNGRFGFYVHFCGQIYAPIEPKMSSKQKSILAKLIVPIVERDKKELIDKSMSSYS